MGHKRSRLLRGGLAVLLAAATIVGLSGGPAVAAAPTAHDQLTWLAGASAHLPIPDADLTAHVSPATLQALGGPDALNQTLEQQVGPFTVTRWLADAPTSVQALARAGGQTVLVKLSTDATGLITGLGFAPYAAAPTSWAALDAGLRQLAPQATFAASEIAPDGRCTVLHGDAPDAQQPLGSAFKLYVLGALGRDIAAGKAGWDTTLAIQDRYKSLPSGQLQNEPAGTRLTLAQFADYMISISDNTAADHLIHYLGRDAVQRQLTAFGNHDPAADTPFPTTRELFALKSVHYPALADTYDRLPAAGRAAVLDAVDGIPRTSLGAWTNPEQVNQIEWFGSATDMCRAFSGLARENAAPGGAPIGAALSLNDGGIGLDRTAYPTLWFKGGSEPGVLTLNYLARTADGRTLVTSVMLTDPAQPIPDAATTAALALARGGLQLADTATR